MKLVSVLLLEEYLKGLHELVRSAMYSSRSAVIRIAVRNMLRRKLWDKQDYESCQDEISSWKLKR